MKTSLGREKLLSALLSAATSLTTTLVFALTLPGCETTEFTGKQVIPATEPTVVEPEAVSTPAPPSTPAPAVTGVSPGNGPEIGGTVLTINGSNFTATSQIKLGTSTCGSFVFVSSSQIRCTSPARPPGVVDVVVINPDTQVGRLEDAFAFTVNLFLCYDGNCPPSNPKVGVNSVHQFSATGGMPTGAAPYYTFSVVSVTPAGAASFAGDMLTAPPTAQTITIRATDDLGTTADATVEILAAPTFTPSTMNIVEGTTKTFTVNAGVPPFDFSIGTTGDCAPSLLPDASDTENAYINVKANSGCNTGDNVTLTVTDDEGNSGTAAVTFIDPVSAGADQQITTGVCSSAITVSPTGGLPFTGGEYDFQITPSCNGCTLDGTTRTTSINFNTGALTAAQDYTIKVTDSEGNYDTMTMKVNPLPDFTVAAGYEQNKLDYDENWLLSYDRIHVIENSAAHGVNYGVAVTGGTLPMGVNYGTTYVYDQGGGPNINDPFASINQFLGLIPFDTPAFNSSTVEYIIWTDSCGKQARIDFRAYDHAVLPATKTIVDGWVYEAPVSNAANAYGPLSCSWKSGPSAIVGYNSTSQTCTVWTNSTGELKIKVTDGFGIESEQTITVNPSIQITPAYAEVEEGKTVSFSAVADTGGDAATRAFSIKYGPGGIATYTGTYQAPGFSPALAQIQLVDESNRPVTAMVRTIEPSGTETNPNNERFGWYGEHDGTLFTHVGSNEANTTKIGIPYVNAFQESHKKPSLAYSADPNCGSCIFFAGAMGDVLDPDNSHSKIFMIRKHLGWDAYPINSARMHYTSPDIVFDQIDIVPNIPGVPNNERVAIFAALTYYRSGSKKYVVAGWHHNGNDRDILVAQYNSSLSREWLYTYDLDGSGTYEEAHALAHDPTNGRILVGGVENKSSAGAADGQAILIALNQDGAMDPTFDDSALDGRDNVSFSTASSDPNVFSILVDGTSIYVAGTNNGDAYVAKWSDADADGDFGQVPYTCAPSTDTQVMMYDHGETSLVRALALSTDSNSLFVGSLLPASKDVGVARLTKSSGCPDAGYGTGGLAKAATAIESFAGMAVSKEPVSQDTINIVGSDRETSWTWDNTTGTFNQMVDAAFNDRWVRLRLAKFTSAGAATATDITEFTNKCDTNGDPGVDLEDYQAGGMILANVSTGSGTAYRLYVLGSGHHEAVNSSAQLRWVVNSLLLFPDLQ